MVDTAPCRQCLNVGNVNIERINVKLLHISVYIGNCLVICLHCSYGYFVVHKHITCALNCINKIIKFYCFKNL